MDANETGMIPSVVGKIKLVNHITSNDKQNQF